LLRATCEACAKPQPRDWKAGDLCVHCGQAVRREVRCFWCVKWTPLAGYCRSCGATVVEPTRFGAARMLKDAGADRFAIPRMLAEFPAEQIDNFARIYQGQAVLVARHVDDVAFLEQFLHHRHWDAALEDDLLARLPMPEDRVAELGGKTWTGGGDRERASFLMVSSPIETTRCLASLAALRLGDFEALRPAWSAFSHPDPKLREEAALALSHWRVLFGPGLESGRNALADELRRSSFAVEAAVRLVFLSREPFGRPEDGLLSRDPDTAFFAALALGDRDLLTAALSSRDESKRVAAGLRLVRLGASAALRGNLRELSEEGQRRLVEELGFVKWEVSPDAREDLYAVAESAKDDWLRRRALRLLGRNCPSGEIRRVARLAHGESGVYQALLQSDGMAPEDLELVCDVLLEEGCFTMHQYGLKDAARVGGVRPDYVPKRFPLADNKARCELLGFAEEQLQNYGDESLHRFVVHVAYGEYAPEVHSQAWSGLFRWYQRIEYGSMGGMQVTPESVVRFFDSPAEFNAVLATFLRRTESLRELFVYDRLWKVLNYASEEAVAEMGRSDGADRLRRALAAVSRDESLDLSLRHACDRFGSMLS
jgi:hypothetical protein